MDDEIESILYIAREVSGKSVLAASLSQLIYYVVFKIPPLRINEGHKATDWGDLGNPLWKGRLRIIEKSESVTIQFEDASTGK